jgi:hypothetical protein
MKTLFSFLLLIAAFTFVSACGDSSSNNPIVYQDNIVNVKLTNITWFTTIHKYSDSLYFGNINLKMNVTTNADQILIKTFGDGLIDWHDVNFNTKTDFNDSIAISFTHFEKSPNGTETNSSTVLIAIKDNDSLFVNLNSGKLIY